VAVQAGVNVVIEASAASSQQAAKLTPFFDEREGSPWHGREDLSTDAQGYIFDVQGRLVGVLRDPPAEQAKPLVQTASVADQDDSSELEEAAREIELETTVTDLRRELADLKTRGQSRVSGRFAQLNW
jgi:hypothetical protein